MALVTSWFINHKSNYIYFYQQNHIICTNLANELGHHLVMAPSFFGHVPSHLVYCYRRIIG